MVDQPKGKVVRSKRYLHKLSLQSESNINQLVAKALQQLNISEENYNVIKIDEEGQTVSFLEYLDFFETAFPVLLRSWNINIISGKQSFRDYRDSRNPPILHRKELLLPEDYKENEIYKKLTSDLEQLNLFSDTTRIGFRIQWNNLLLSAGYKVLGHSLLPIGNDVGETIEELEPLDNTPDIMRHMTALARQNLSAPMSAMLRLGLLNKETKIFDYGCGRGGDIEILNSMGISASGWDPYYAPNNELISAPLVNLGFVINVIEDPHERSHALKRAYSLSEIALCVSAMLASDDSTKGTPFADGIITRRNTFQKYYTQTQLREYIESVLDTGAIAVAPGVFLIFKDKASEQSFLIRRLSSKSRIISNETYNFSKKPRPEKKSAKVAWHDCENEFLELCRVWEILGREPIIDEIKEKEVLINSFGTIKKAINCARSKINQESVTKHKLLHMDDICVHLALQRFSSLKPYRNLEKTLQYNIKSFWGDYARALADSNELIADLADVIKLDYAAKIASEKGLGYWVPNDSFYCSAYFINRIPALLRLYLGCGQILYGDISSADIIKLHLQSKKISLIKFDNFLLRIPLITERIIINLREQKIKIIRNKQQNNNPLQYFYCKSRVMNEDLEGYAEQRQFDDFLEKYINISDDFMGPNLTELNSIINLSGKMIDQTGLRNLNKIPNLEDSCGAYLKYSDLILCGETVHATKLNNIPKSINTYSALRNLAEKILDPTISWFGSIKLTYGFCSHDLTKKIKSSISPADDQHSSYETNSKGNLICKRGGAAVDFLVEDEDMFEVAKWVAANTPFDRIYYYGNNRPIHVSYGPDNKRQFFEMTKLPNGRKMPKRLKVSVFDPK